MFRVVIEEEIRIQRKKSAKFGKMLDLVERLAREFKHTDCCRVAWFIVNEAPFQNIYQVIDTRKDVWVFVETLEDVAEIILAELDK